MGNFLSFPGPQFPPLLNDEEFECNVLLLKVRSVHQEHGVSVGNLLEMQNLCPTPNLVNQNLLFNKILRRFNPQ